MTTDDYNISVQGLVDSLQSELHALMHAMMLPFAAACKGCDSNIRTSLITSRLSTRAGLDGLQAAYTDLLSLHSSIKQQCSDAKSSQLADTAARARLKPVRMLTKVLQLHVQPIKTMQLLYGHLELAQAFTRALQLLSSQYGPCMFERVPNSVVESMVVLGSCLEICTRACSKPSKQRLGHVFWALATAAMAWAVMTWIVSLLPRNQLWLLGWMHPTLCCMWVAFMLAIAIDRPLTRYIAKQAITLTGKILHVCPHTRGSSSASCTS